MKDIYSNSQEFFSSILSSPEGTKACGVLSKKQISLNQAQNLGLGFAPPLTSELLHHLTGSFDMHDILESRLVVESFTGKGYYDRFRNRITLPVKDETGQVVGFIGRALEGGQPLYMTTPQTTKALMDDAIKAAESLFGD